MERLEGRERAAGTYAWIAGWHDETGNLGVLMHGGGRECDGDEAVDKKKGLTVAHMKLTAGILATNDRLATYSETDAKCPCCGARNETQNHLLGHCPHKELAQQRQERGTSVRHSHQSGKKH